MGVFFTHCALLGVCGTLLFFLWRAAAPDDRWLSGIVAAGFLLRAIAGEALFWIAWRRLPILRSLQTGNGGWTFALDGERYFIEAGTAAAHGLGAILFYDRGAASVSYIQLLSGLILLVGNVTSVALLLNLFCYLGTVALLGRWRGAPRRARAVAVAAVSLSPSLVLWSLAPLKDSVFLLLFVGFVAICAVWQRAWLTAGTWRQRGGAGAAVAGVLFLLAGVRWYVAVVLIAATSVFLLAVALTSRERRTASLGAAAAVVLVMLGSLALSAGSLVPAGSILAAVDHVRLGFEQTPANTTIRSSAAAVAGMVPAHRLAAADEAKIRRLLADQEAAWNRYDAAQAMSGYWQSPEFEFVDGTRVVRGFDQTAREYRRGRLDLGRLQLGDLRIGGEGDTASISGRWQWTTASGAPQSHAFLMTMRRFPGGDWKIVREEYPLAVPSRLQRLAVGAAALVMPRLLGERLGLFDRARGHASLWFSEIDTVAFDAVLMLSVCVIVATRHSMAWRTPLAWLVLLATVTLAALLAYTIGNFGTLIRLRAMIYVGLLLIPIVATSEAGDGHAIIAPHRQLPDRAA